MSIEALVLAKLEVVLLLEIAKNKTILKSAHCIFIL